MANKKIEEVKENLTKSKGTEAEAVYRVTLNTIEIFKKLSSPS